MDFNFNYINIIESPILLSIIIVIITLMIMFFIAYRYFKRHAKQLLRIGIYSLLTTTTALFLHDKMLTQKYEDSHSDQKLEDLVVGQGERIRSPDEITEDSEEDLQTNPTIRKQNVFSEELSSMEPISMNLVEN